MKLSRRNLLVSASSGAFMASVGPGLRVSMAAEGSTSGDILVVLFARGGTDGLQLVAPADVGEYQDARPTNRCSIQWNRCWHAVGQWHWWCGLLQCMLKQRR